MGKSSKGECEDWKADNWTMINTKEEGEGRKVGGLEAKKESAQVREKEVQRG